MLRKIINTAILFQILFVQYQILAQDTTWFDAKWNKVSTRDSAEYYRLAEKQGEKWHVRDYFLSNNRVQMEGTFKSLEPLVVKDGDFVYYYKNGNFRQIVTFLNDTVSGAVTVFYENGNISAIYHLHGDKYVGSFKLFRDEGNLGIKGFYSDNEDYAYQQHISSEDLKMFEGWVRDSLRIGKWITYNMKGKVARVNYYPNEFVLDKARLKITFPTIEWNRIEPDKLNTQFAKFEAKPLWDSLNDGLYPQITFVYFDNTKGLFDIDTVLKANLVNMDLSNFVLIKTLTPTDSAYPLLNKNSLIRIFKSKVNLDYHLLCTAGMITSNHTGVQIFMDIRKNIANNEEEFYQILRSIKELE